MINLDHETWEVRNFYSNLVDIRRTRTLGIPSNIPPSKINEVIQAVKGYAKPKSRTEQWARKAIRKGILRPYSRLFLQEPTPNAVLIDGCWYAVPREWEEPKDPSPEPKDPILRHRAQRTTQVKSKLNDAFLSPARWVDNLELGFTTTDNQEVSIGIRGRYIDAKGRGAWGRYIGWSNRDVIVYMPNGPTETIDNTIEITPILGWTKADLKVGADPIPPSQHYMAYETSTHMKSITKTRARAPLGVKTKIKNQVANALFD